MFRILLLLTLFIGPVALSQDHFALVVQNDDTTYNYPPNVTFTLTDEFDNEVEILKDDSTLVTGNYTLQIDVPWSSKPEIIKSKGGSLEIFILPIDIRERSGEQDATWETVHYESSVKHDKKPYLEEEEFSTNEIGEKDAYFVFSNGMTISFRGDRVWAYQDGERLKVEGKYLVKGEYYMLKISYTASTGKMWYVFESLLE